MLLYYLFIFVILVLGVEENLDLYKWHVECIAGLLFVRDSLDRQYVSFGNRYLFVSLSLRFQ